MNSLDYNVFHAEPLFVTGTLLSGGTGTLLLARIGTSLEWEPVAWDGNNVCPWTTHMHVCTLLTDINISFDEIKHLHTHQTSAYMYTDDLAVLGKSCLENCLKSFSTWKSIGIPYTFILWDGTMSWDGSIPCDGNIHSFYYSTLMNIITGKNTFVYFFLISFNISSAALFN